MAYVEPMDVDNIGSDFDDKENSLQNSNVLPRTPCTEKGYEELDVSELNMKLRYSITPASSPMSRSYTANCKDNKILNHEDNLNNTIVNENSNLTRSLNSTLTKCENVVKSGKLPLQALSSDQYDCDNTPSIRRSLNVDINNCTITVSGPDNFDDNLSLPSTSSSCVQTPEATTPTKDMPKEDGGSPIMRGLKSVLNMFRSSQSPIPPEEVNSKDLSSVEPLGQEAPLPPTTLSSTPINTNKNKENNTSKRNSPLKDSVTFNEDLERELQWKDETTIIFKQEKIPIHKLFFQQPNSVLEQKLASKMNVNLNTTVEHMDISYNESFVADKTMTDIESKPTSNTGETISCVESDSEFVDCETTYTNNEEQSTSGLSVSIPPNTENNEKQDLKDVASVGKENEALSHDLKISSNVTLNEGGIEIKIKDVTIVKEAITSNVISENNIISTDKSNINTCSISHSDGNHFTSVAPVLDDLELNMTENYTAQSNKEDVHSLDSKNYSNIEINKNENDLKFPEANVPNPHVDNEIIKSDIEEYMNDITTPLNIITDYQEYVIENNSSVVDNDSQEISTDKNSTKHLGLLKEYDIGDNVNKTITQHDPENIKQDNNEILKNELNDSCNILNVNNGNNTFDTVDHTNGPDLTYFDDNNLIDDKNLKTKEVNDTIVQESINEDSNLTSHCLQNIDNKNPNDIDLQKLDCLDIIHKTSDNSNIDTEIYNLDKINTSNNILKNKTENIVDNAELKELLLDEVPSDIPLPLEDDIEKSDIKDPLGVQEENIILVSEGDVVSNILTVNSNVTPEVSQSNDKILSDLTVTSTDLEEVTVPKQILSPHKEIINEISMMQDCISSSNIARDNIDSENSKINSENFDSIPKTDTSAIDIQMNIDACTNYRQSVFDDKSEKSSDIQEGKSISNPVDITIKTRAADDVNIISSNDDLHVSVENLNNERDDLELENIENPFETKTKLGESPPISPKLGRIGYNINFDDIDDPFATKTNIRTSPPPPSSESTFNSSSTSLSTATSNETQKKIENKRVPLQNRRKSQPERKKQHAVRKPFNKSFDFSGLKQHREEPVINIDKPRVFQNEIEVKKQNVSSNKSITDVIAEPKVSNNLIMEISTTVENESPSGVDVESNNEDNLNNITIVTSEKVDIDLKKELHEFTKNSACDTAPRNVFNLPEIDDVHFNPFATKSRVRQSPPPTPCSPKVINDKIESKVESVNDITINIENTTKDHKHLSPIVSSASGSSESTNVKENTIGEVQTEDEDTIEGPFFEADELNDIDKLSDYESNKDIMPCENFPAESENDKKDEELFIDAEAFEFLLNQNKTNVVADSGKESLFLKFDPLFAKRVSSDGVLSALNRIQKRQSTPRKLAVADKINETIVTTTASTSTKNPIEESVDETSFLASKPMMVVNPAVNSLVSPRKSTTPPRINRRSLTFTSPAMAVIDRLLSLSGNTSLLDHDTSTLQVTKEYNDTDIALTQLRELLAEKEIHVHNLRLESKELKERLATMESQVRSLEKESEDRLNKVTELNKRLAEKTKMNKSMSIVVEEYERTIASLIAEMDEEKRRNAEERTRLISERDEQTAHLSSMEVSFSDLHSKYEKSKQIILSMKANEDTYKKSIKEFEDNLIKMQKNYELLKQHATSKLNHANQELEKFNRSHEAEVLKLNAMIKRKELHITSLEESLTQKTKANEELTAICDELINKVG